MSQRCVRNAEKTKSRRHCKERIQWRLAKVELVPSVSLFWRWCGYLSRIRDAMSTHGAQLETASSVQCTKRAQAAGHKICLFLARPKKVTIIRTGNMSSRLTRESRPLRFPWFVDGASLGSHFFGGSGLSQAGTRPVSDYLSRCFIETRYVLPSQSCKVRGFYFAFAHGAFRTSSIYKHRHLLGAAPGGSDLYWSQQYKVAAALCICYNQAEIHVILH